MNNKLIDPLTGIGNSEYFEKNYKSYNKHHQNSQLIMIDIEKFKHINDNLGHNIGDLYLKILAKILEKNFQDSLVVRIHGDEFIILTCLSENKINKVFQDIEKKIHLLVEREKIPAIFRINAGSCPFNINNIEETMEKADLMMYLAKKNSKFYQPYSTELWMQKKDEKKFITAFKKCLKNQNLSYTKKQLFSLSGTPQEIYQIYTNSPDGISLLGEENYKLLRKNNLHYSLDNYNIIFLIERLLSNPEKNIISIDYLSLIKNNNIIKYLAKLSTIQKENFNKIIINIKVYPETSREELILCIKKIEELKALGFMIKIDKINDFTRDAIFQYAPIDYVGFDNDYVRKAMYDSQVNYFLTKKIDMITNFPNSTIIPVFSHINTASEFEHINKYYPKNSLANGKYYIKKRKN